MTDYALLVIFILKDTQYTLITKIITGARGEFFFVCHR